MTVSYHFKDKMALPWATMMQGQCRFGPFTFFCCQLRDHSYIFTPPMNRKNISTLILMMTSGKGCASTLQAHVDAGHSCRMEGGARKISHCAACGQCETLALPFAGIGLAPTGAESSRPQACCIAHRVPTYRSQICYLVFDEKGKRVLQ